MTQLFLMWCFVVAGAFISTECRAFSTSCWSGNQNQLQLLLHDGRWSNLDPNSRFPRSNGPQTFTPELIETLRAVLSIPLVIFPWPWMLYRSGGQVNFVLQYLHLNVVRETKLTHISGSPESTLCTNSFPCSFPCESSLQHWYLMASCPLT
jgi:hypothetical protein